MFVNSELKSTRFECPCKRFTWKVGQTWIAESLEDGGVRKHGGTACRKSTLKLRVSMGIEWIPPSSERGSYPCDLSGHFQIDRPRYSLDVSSVGINRRRINLATNLRARRICGHISSHNAFLAGAGPERGS